MEPYEREILAIDGVSLSADNEPKKGNFRSIILNILNKIVMAYRRGRRSFRRGGRRRNRFRQKRRVSRYYTPSRGGIRL